MYLTLFRSLPTPALFFNKELALINANDAAVQLFCEGKTKERKYEGTGIAIIPVQQLETTLQEFLATGDLELDTQMDIATVRGKEYFKVRLRRLEDVSGEFEGMVAILSDITAMYTSEQQLRQSKERFQLLFNSGSDAVFVYNLEDDGRPGPFIEVNDVACQMLDMDKETLTGLTVGDIVAPTYQQDLLADIESMMFQDHILRQISCITAQGTLVDVEVNSRIFELGGKKSVLSIARNITEKNRMEAEMRRLSRMHLVGEMAAGLGHELRNPMTTVRGFLQVLQESDTREKACQYYQIMIEELDRANTIITEYLNLAKDKTVTLTSVNINAIIGSLLPFIQSDAMLAKHNVKLRLRRTANLLVDEKEVRQLILNLCRNGLEAMEAGGLLTLDTYMDGELVAFVVTDEGKGIPASLHDKIGTPFFTTKDKGVGLGLAICYSIAARNSATIDFTSNPCGTTFSVKFAPFVRPKTI